MKLYSKHLSSIEELRKEKQKLKRKVKNADLGMDNPLAQFTAPKVKKQSSPADTTEAEQDKGGGALGTIADIVSSPAVREIVGSMGLPLISVAGRMLPKKAIMRAGVALVGGYVKWKLVELGYRSIKSYLKAQKEKATKAAEELADQ